MKRNLFVSIFFSLLALPIFIACPPYWNPDEVDISNSVDVKFDSTSVKVGEQNPFELAFDFDTSTFTGGELQLEVYAANDRTGNPSFIIKDGEDEIYKGFYTVYVSLDEENLKTKKKELNITFFEDGYYSINLSLRLWNEEAYSYPGGKIGFFAWEKSFDVDYPYEMESLDISDYVTIDFNTASINVAER